MPSSPGTSVADSRHQPSQASEPPWADIVATYSPCCLFLRLGLWAPPTMHTSLCRAAHNGELGPTLHLTVRATRPAEAEWDGSVPDGGVS